jgi:hypothetical protein
MNYQAHMSIANDGNLRIRAYLPDRPHPCLDPYELTTAPPPVGGKVNNIANMSVRDVNSPS